MNIVYLNGSFLPASDALISPEDRGFLLGDGVFDTLRSYGGVLFRFDDHARRFFGGLEEVRIAAPFDPDGLKNILTELMLRNGKRDCIIRITISRGLGAGGYRMPEISSPTVYASMREAPDIAKIRANGLTLSCSPIPRPLPFLSVVKTTSIGAMALARAIADEASCSAASRTGTSSATASRNATSRSIDEVIMMDANGHVAEGTASTLYAIRGEKVFSPPSKYLLPSTTRQLIGELTRVEERSMTREDFLSADAIFLSATSMGPAPVHAVDEHTYPLDHPIMDKLFAAYDREVETYREQYS